MKVLFIGAGKASQMISSIHLEKYPSDICDAIDDNQLLWNQPFQNGIIVNSSLEKLEDVILGYDSAFIGIAIHKLMNLRQTLFNRLSGKIELLNVIHPTAYVSDSATLGMGNYIGAYSYIAPYVNIGNCNFFSAYTCIEHHSSVGSLNSWGPKNSTSGSCCIGNNVCLGTNISTIYEISVGDNCIIGSGVLLDKNVEALAIVRLDPLKNYSVRMKTK